jgi:hypothetical protein
VFWLPVPTALLPEQAAFGTFKIKIEKNTEKIPGPGIKKRRGYRLPLRLFILLW